MHGKALSVRYIPLFYRKIVFAMPSESAGQYCINLKEGAVSSNDTKHLTPNGSGASTPEQG